MAWRSVLLALESHQGTQCFGCLISAADALSVRRQTSRSSRKRPSKPVSVAVVHRLEYGRILRRCTRSKVPVRETMCNSWRGLFLVVVFLSGCQTIPEYKNSILPDAVCVKGNFAKLTKWFSEGEAHVLIKEIDGVPTDGRKQYCFNPGIHTLGVYAINNYQEAQDYFQYDFLPARRYWFHGNFTGGISFAIQVEDITTEPVSKVAEFRLKAGRTGQPITVPVVVR